MAIPIICPHCDAHWAVAEAWTARGDVRVACPTCGLLVPMPAPLRTERTTRRSIIPLPEVFQGSPAVWTALLILGLIFAAAGYWSIQSAEQGAALAALAAPDAAPPVRPVDTEEDVQPEPENAGVYFTIGSLNVQGTLQLEGQEPIPFGAGPDATGNRMSPTLMLPSGTYAATITYEAVPEGTKDPALLVRALSGNVSPRSNQRLAQWWSADKSGTGTLSFTLQ